MAQDNTLSLTSFSSCWSENSNNLGDEITVRLLKNGKELSGVSSLGGIDGVLQAVEKALGRWNFKTKAFPVCTNSGLCINVEATATIVYTGSSCIVNVILKSDGGGACRSEIIGQHTDKNPLIAAAWAYLDALNNQKWDFEEKDMKA